MANIREELIQIGFSTELQRNFQEKLQDYYELFLSLVAREVAAIAENKVDLQHVSTAGKRMLMDHMGTGIIDAVEESPEKWLRSEVRT